MAGYGSDLYGAHLYGVPALDPVITPTGSLRSVLPRVDNYCPNPSFESVAALTPWAALWNITPSAGSTSALDTAKAYSGLRSLRVTVAPADAGGAPQLVWFAYQDMSLPMAAGREVTLSIFYHCESEALGIAVNFDAKNAAGAVIQATSSPRPTGTGYVSSAAHTPSQWGRISVNAVIPDNAASVAIGIEVYTMSAAGGTIWIDAAMLTSAVAGNIPYGDGSLPGWAWVGTAHNSTSYRIPVEVDQALTGTGGVVGWEPRYWRSDKAGRKIEDITAFITNGRVIMNPDASPCWTLSGQTIEHDLLHRLVDYLLVEVTQVYADGVEVTEPLGHYRVTTVSPRHLAGGSAADFTAGDLTGVVRRMTLPYPYTVVVGQNYTELMTYILTAVCGFAGSQVAIPPSTKVAVIETTYEAGESYLKVVNDCALAVGLRTIHMTRQGVMTTSLSVELEAQQPVARYTAGDALPGKSHPIIGAIEEDPDDSRVRNRATVRRITPGSPAIYATADNLDPASPLYIYGPIGVLAGDPVDDPQLVDQATADIKARELVSIGSSYYAKVTLNIKPDLRIAPYDTVELSVTNDDGNVIDAVFWRRVVDTPLGPPMSALSSGQRCDLNRTTAFPRSTP